MRSLLIFLMLLIMAAPQAQAGMNTHGRDNQLVFADADDERELRTTQSNGPSLSDAVEMVKQQCKCRIVSAKTRISGNREVHHIKALTEDGKVKTYRIQGRTRQP